MKRKRIQFAVMFLYALIVFGVAVSGVRAGEGILWLIFRKKRSILKDSSEIIK